MADSILDTIESRYPQLDWHEVRLLEKSPENPYYNTIWKGYDIDVEYLPENAVYSVKMYDLRVTLLHSVKRSLDESLQPLDRFFEANPLSLSSE